MGYNSFNFTPAPSKPKGKDKDFEQMLQDFRDAYYNSGDAKDGGHCFRFIAIRAPASSLAGFMSEMQEPIKQLVEAKEKVAGFATLDALFVPKVAGVVGRPEEQMNINRSNSLGKFNG